MNETILLCTAVAEVFLVVGYALRSWHQFIAEGRAMYMALAAMLENYIPEDYERG